MKVNKGGQIPALTGQQNKLANSAVHLHLRPSPDPHHSCRPRQSRRCSYRSSDRLDSSWCCHKRRMRRRTAATPTWRAAATGGSGRSSPQCSAMRRTTAATPESRRGATPPQDHQTTGARRRCFSLPHLQFQARLAALRFNQLAHRPASAPRHLHQVPRRIKLASLKDEGVREMRSRQKV